MATSQGDGVAGSCEGNTRSQARPRKRDKGLCLLCMKSGRKSRLQLFQIGSNEAMYLCSNETCPYPVSMFDDLHSSVVSREITELKISSPQKTTGERPSTTTNFPTSMPLVVPVEVQKIPTMPKEDVHFKRSSASDITEDRMNQFKVWMQSKKQSSRSSSLSQETRNNYKNGDLKEKGYLLANKRVRSNNTDAESKMDKTGRSRLASHSIKIPLRGDNNFSTNISIRKIDKTLMEASGLDVDKKFEPFKITPKETLPSPTPDVTDVLSEDITNLEEDPLVDDGDITIDTQVFHTPIEDNIHNNNLTETNVPDNMSNAGVIQSNTDLMQMNSLQIPMLSPEQWQPHTPQPMSMQNGHVTDPLYHSSMLPPQYIQNNYNMMSQYNELLPPTPNYHDMTGSVPPSLQSPLSPMPHPSNNYTNEQFYYPESIYTDYTEQWEDLELTKMLDAIDMPPTEQYDPTLGILPPGTSQPPDIYDVMGPNAMATPVDMPCPYDRPHPSLPMPINSPLISPPISQPLSNTQNPISQMTSPLNEIAQMGIANSVYSMDTNNIGDAVTSFNNIPESPMSCYQSPLPQGEYQNLSLVESAT